MGSMEFTDFSKVAYLSFVLAPVSKELDVEKMRTYYLCGTPRFEILRMPLKTQGRSTSQFSIRC